MSKKIGYMVNPNTGHKVQVYAGFSWTTFFFGIIPAMWRGMWKWAILGFILYVPTFGVFWVVSMFKLNKWHIETLREKGYVMESELQTRTREKDAGSPVVDWT